MACDQNTITNRLALWFDGMEQFSLPEWEQLPQLDLYMDQVILLLKQYLSPLYHGQEEKSITASIINNYVRMKVMSPPVKKKYSRMHLASLIMICVLKQSLSISCIRRMLPEDQNEESMQQLYREFTAQYRTIQELFVRQAKDPLHPLPSQETAQLLTTCAIVSTLSTELTEFLLQEENDEKSGKR